MCYAIFVRCDTLSKSGISCLCRHQSDLPTVPSVHPSLWINKRYIHTDHTRGHPIGIEMHGVNIWKYRAAGLSRCFVSLVALVTSLHNEAVKICTGWAKKTALHPFFIAVTLAAPNQFS